MLVLVLATVPLLLLSPLTVQVLIAYSFVYHVPLLSRKIGHPELLRPDFQKSTAPVKGESILVSDQIRM